MEDQYREEGNCQKQILKRPLEQVVTVRPFAPEDARAVSRLICRNFLEVNSRDYGIAEMEKRAAEYTPRKVAQIAGYEVWLRLQERKKRTGRRGTLSFGKI